jgi:hypothetical protein
VPKTKAKPKAKAAIRDQFTKKERKDCCGGGCKKCKIAAAYIEEYGKEKGLKKLKKDQQG